MRWARFMSRIGETTKLWLENMKEGPKGRSENSVRMIPDVVGRQCGLVHSVQNTDQYWALLNKVMNSFIPYSATNFLAR